ncbi:unnamed protein product [Vitrella brassicaformis CCMP3155]|uniref:Transmembrane protein 222 n=2 Tax=Vitrella brassicaformis TaxID=1169539 RepID=A0A0G4GLI3_VITBC|nr:unnamed protein product [Vitrella brassicaformis CCMP3155]|eukprot:CEM30996.1 unnamed protein product [Vitrella brassicaformis CCMP3155]
MRGKGMAALPSPLGRSQSALPHHHQQHPSHDTHTSRPPVMFGMKEVPVRIYEGEFTPTPRRTRSLGEEGEIVHDRDRDRYPFCLIWTPIPLLTYFVPIIGHAGICASDGACHDFAGPYHIGIDAMAFGRPTKYLQLKPQDALLDWDEAVHGSDCKFGKEMHNLACNNCHHHIAKALNDMKYRGSSNWTQFHIFAWFLVYGKYTSVEGAVKTWLPFLVIVTIIILFTFVFGPTNTHHVHTNVSPFF